MSGGPLAELRAAVKSLDSVAEKLEKAAAPEQPKLLQAFEGRFADVEKIWRVVHKPKG